MGGRIRWREVSFLEAAVHCHDRYPQRVNWPDGVPDDPGSSADGHSAVTFHDDTYLLVQADTGQPRFWIGRPVKA